MFKKAKKTFLMSAGRLGAPSARKPSITKSPNRKSSIGGVKIAKLPKASPIGKAKIVPMAKKIATRPAKGAVNSYRMSKKAPGKTSSTLMSKKPAGRSATHSPQSISNTARPRG